MKISADEFEREFSGGGSMDSRVSFAELGIRNPVVTRISLSHPPANFTGATIEIPGNSVLIKNQNSIVFSVCNVYFEARRKLEHIKTVQK